MISASIRSLCWKFSAVVVLTAGLFILSPSVNAQGTCHLCDDGFQPCLSRCPANDGGACQRACQDSYTGCIWSCNAANGQPYPGYHYYGDRGGYSVQERQICYRTAHLGTYRSCFRNVIRYPDAWAACNASTPESPSKAQTCCEDQEWQYIYENCFGL